MIGGEKVCQRHHPQPLTKAPGIIIIGSHPASRVICTGGRWWWTAAKDGNGMPSFGFGAKLFGNATTGTMLCLSGGGRARVSSSVGLFELPLPHIRDISSNMHCHREGEKKKKIYDLHL